MRNDTRSRTAGTCSERTRDTPPTLTISNLLRRQRRRRGAEPVVPSACKWPAEPAEDGRGTAAIRRTASSRTTTTVSRRRCSDKKLKLKRTDDKVNCCCNCGCQRDDDDDNNERRQPEDAEPARNQRRSGQLLLLHFNPTRGSGVQFRTIQHGMNQTVSLARSAIVAISDGKTDTHTHTLSPIKRQQCFTYKLFAASKGPSSTKNKQVTHAFYIKAAATRRWRTIFYM